MEIFNLTHETVDTAKYGEGWGARVVLKSSQGEVLVNGEYPPCWGENSSVAAPSPANSNALTEREAVDLAYDNAYAKIAARAITNSL